jgi:hypothetical protein
MSIVLAGSTSGSVTLQEPAIAGTTVLDLPAVSGTILTTGSSGQSIPKAALPTGSVLQVVNATYVTETSNATTTYVDTGLSATITPTSSSSKILVIVDQSDIYSPSSGNPVGVKIQLLRGSTSILVFTGYAGYQSLGNIDVGSATCNYLDSPATTSATTYKTQFAKQANNTGTVYVQNGGVGYSSITLMEIAA